MDTREESIHAAVPNLDKEFGFQLEVLRKEKLAGWWAFHERRVLLCYKGLDEWSYTLRSTASLASSLSTSRPASPTQRKS